MKHDTHGPKDKIRRSLATIVACVIVLGVPLLSIRQFWHPHSTPSRPATTLPALQERAIDRTKPTSKLSKESLISVAFDDSYESPYKEAVPILQRNSVHSTQYILSGVDDKPEYLSWAQIKGTQQSGHKIGCLSIGHGDLTTSTDKQLMEHQALRCVVTVGKRF